MDSFPLESAARTAFVLGALVVLVLIALAFMAGRWWPPAPAAPAAPPDTVHVAAPAPQDTAAQLASASPAPEREPDIRIQYVERTDTVRVAVPMPRPLSADRFSVVHARPLSVERAPGLTGFLGFAHRARLTRFDPAALSYIEDVHEIDAPRLTIAPFASAFAGPGAAAVVGVSARFRPFLRGPFRTAAVEISGGTLLDHRAHSLGAGIPPLPSAHVALRIYPFQFAR